MQKQWKPLRPGSERHEDNARIDCKQLAHEPESGLQVQNQLAANFHRPKTGGGEAEDETEDE